MSIHEASLRATQFNLIGTKSVGKEQTVSVWFDSPDEEYFGTLYLFAGKNDIKGRYASRSAVVVPKGDSVAASFFFTPSETGTYTLWLTFDEAGRRVLKQSTVNIAQEAQEVPLVIEDTRYRNQIGKAVYGRFIDGTVTVKNTHDTETFRGDLDVFCWRRVRGGDFTYTYLFRSVPMTIKPGQSVEASYLFDRLPEGYEYIMSYQVAGKGITVDNQTAEQRTVEMRNGMVYYRADGSRFVAESYKQQPETATDIAAVDMRSMTDVQGMQPMENPNVLYIFDKHAAIPEALQGKNIIQDGVAETIKLTDGYPYYSPTAYHAKSISYTRSFSKGTDGKYWETFSVPFSVQTITQESTPLYWRAASGEGSGIWLKEFWMVDADTKVRFSMTKDHLANVPYLLSVPQALKDKAITFTAQNADMKASSSVKMFATTDSYTYAATTTKADKAHVYMLNDAGTAFIPQETGTTEPFRAYFMAKRWADGHRHPINIVAEATAVDGVAVEKEEQMVHVYNLNGIRVASVGMVQGKVNIAALPKGVYIVQGKKIVR